MLPKALECEPLVDAVFEVRLGGTPFLADILPGFLLHELDSTPTVKRLPPADIPQPMRAIDPALQFAPIQRLEYSDHFISVGDRNIVISCKLPYPKWPKFKETILNVIMLISKIKIVEKVERYSLKYVNVISAPTNAEQVAKIKMEITLGAIRVSDDLVNLRVERQEGDTVHILSVITGAAGKLQDGSEMSGVVVDIDSIRNIAPEKFTDFASRLGDGVEQLRQANKAKFFDCLTEATINEMGPIYE